MACVVAGTDARGRPLDLEDPLAERLRDAAEGSSDATGVVDRLLGVREVFDAELAGSEVFRSMLAEDVAELLAGEVPQ
jgi:fructuronate reductase